MCVVISRWKWIFSMFVESTNLNSTRRDLLSVGATHSALATRNEGMTRSVIPEHRGVHHRHSPPAFISYLPTLLVGRKQPNGILQRRTAPSRTVVIRFERWATFSSTFAALPRGLVTLASGFAALPHRLTAPSSGIAENSAGPLPFPRFHGGETALSDHKVSAYAVTATKKSDTNRSSPHAPRFLHRSAQRITHPQEKPRTKLHLWRSYRNVPCIRGKYFEGKTCPEF